MTITTDFHTHILPSVDDGAFNLQESLIMIDELNEVGINRIIMTPHFYPHKISLDKFINKRKTAHEELISNIGNNTDKNVSLTLASETYLNDYLFNYEDISKLCLNENSKYILTELPYFDDMSSITYKNIYRLINNYSVIPILAHIERYSFLMKNIKLLKELIDMGCLCQMNLMSLNDITLRRRLLKYIKGSLIHLLGTDFHSPPFDSKTFYKSLNIISKHLGDEYIQRFEDNANEILG